MMVDNHVSPVRLPKQKPMARRVYIEEHEETDQDESYSPQFIRGLERSYPPYPHTIRCTAAEEGEIELEPSPKRRRVAVKKIEE